MKKKKGFTLIEIIVVVVILGVLLAVAIPSVLAYIDQTQATACAANRDALGKELLAAYYAGGLRMTEQDVSLTEKQKNSCPAGGTITVRYVDGLVHVYCSIHEKPYTLRDPATLQSVITTMQKFTSTIDSNAAASQGTVTAKAQATAALAGLGLNLQELGAQSWQFRAQSATESYFFWTDATIDALPANTKIPVIRFNGRTGTYTVWISTVNQRTQSPEQTVLYNALNTNANGGFSGPQAYKPSTEQDKVQSYETALALLKQAQQAYPAGSN